MPIKLQYQSEARFFFEQDYLHHLSADFAVENKILLVVGSRQILQLVKIKITLRLKNTMENFFPSFTFDT